MPTRLPSIHRAAAGSDDRRHAGSRQDETAVAFWKFATSRLARSMVIVHVPTPVQPAVPDQPVKVDPGAGAAVTVTTVPE